MLVVKSFFIVHGCLLAPDEWVQISNLSPFADSARSAEEMRRGQILDCCKAGPGADDSRNGIHEHGRRGLVSRPRLE
jgi:hypothetical protein